MSNRNGNFVWFEIASTDKEKAKAFYTDLIGWTVHDMDMGPMGVYHVLQVGDQGVGGIMSAPEGAPSHWISSLSVPDVDAAVKAATDAGGSVVMPPTDIPTVGRLARLADPHGAHFMVFKAADGDPTKITEKQGSFHWNELWSKNAEESVDFYRKVWDFKHTTMDMPQGKYHTLKVSDDNLTGGIMTSPDPKVPPMWLGYIEVDDCDATCAKAEALGGEIKKAAETMPGIGRFAIIADNTGGVVGVITPDRS